MWRYFLLLILAGSLLTACKTKKDSVTEPKESSTTNTDTSLGTQPQTSLQEIADKPKQYLNKVVYFEGRFMGYSGGACEFLEAFAKQPPLTRSDWVFSNAGQCCYVTGGNPGLNPMQDKNTKIHLKAKVGQNKDGKLYLKYLDGSRY